MTSGQTRAIRSFLLTISFGRGSESDQNVERARTQIDRRALLGEEPFAHQQIERAERQTRPELD